MAKRRAQSELQEALGVKVVKVLTSQLIIEFGGISPESEQKMVQRYLSSMIPPQLPDKGIRKQ